MKVVIIGRGYVGGGLAALWRKTGDQVTELGLGGGASAADVVVVAVPGLASARPWAVTCLADKIAIDATNAFPPRNEAFLSPAEQVKLLTGGPAAKSFNVNSAVLYGQIASQRVRPSSFYVTEDGTRQVTEQLITDVSYAPVPLGGVDRACALEDLTRPLPAAMKDGAPHLLLLRRPPANCERQPPARPRDETPPPRPLMRLADPPFHSRATTEVRKP